MRGHVRLRRSVFRDSFGAFNDSLMVMDTDDMCRDDAPAHPVQRKQEWRVIFWQKLCTSLHNWSRPVFPLPLPMGRTPRVGALRSAGARCTHTVSQCCNILGGPAGASLPSPQRRRSPGTDGHHFGDLPLRVGLCLGRVPDTCLLTAECDGVVRRSDVPSVRTVRGPPAPARLCLPASASGLTRGRDKCNFLSHWREIIP